MTLFALLSLCSSLIHTSSHRLLERYEWDITTWATCPREQAQDTQDSRPACYSGFKDEAQMLMKYEGCSQTVLERILGTWVSLSVQQVRRLRPRERERPYSRSHPDRDSNGQNPFLLPLPGLVFLPLPLFLGKPTQYSNNTLLFIWVLES